MGQDFEKETKNLTFSLRRILMSRSVVRLHRRTRWHVKRLTTTPGRRRIHCGRLVRSGWSTMSLEVLTGVRSQDHEFLASLRVGDNRGHFVHVVLELGSRLCEAESRSSLGVSK